MSAHSQYSHWLPLWDGRIRSTQPSTATTWCMKTWRTTTAISRILICSSAFAPAIPSIIDKLLGAFDMRDPIQPRTSLYHVSGEGRRVRLLQSKLSSLRTDWTGPWEVPTDGSTRDSAARLPPRYRQLESNHRASLAVKSAGVPKMLRNAPTRAAVFQPIHESLESRTCTCALSVGALADIVSGEVGS